ncbi:hypothetical protein [Vibrio casei]|uniref:hypothetical protein n=1 Tax=Vibrio casei TaxID=673372 RepID=UPI003F9BE452
MSYIYNNESHTDYSNDYMNNLGIGAETQDSILAMRDYEYQKLAEKEQQWVIAQLGLLDIAENMLNDGDERASMALEEIAIRRKSLRDYVTYTDGKLIVHGERP